MLRPYRPDDCRILADLFYHTVQIDNKVFDLLANVRKKQSGEYVYSLQLNEDKKTKAAPPENLRQDGGFNGAQVASTESVAQEDNPVKKDFSVDAKTDADYLDAVNRGDLETAQKMVDEAAKAAGYTVKGYHGSAYAGFTVANSHLWFARDKVVADGSAICDALEAKCKVRPLVTYASITARPFFEARGYVVIRENWVERRGICLKNYRMEKTVSCPVKSFTEL